MQLRVPFLATALVMVACGDADAPPTQQPSIPASDEAPAMTEIEFTPTDVQLSFSTGEMRIRGTLVHAAGPVPPRVWVWAYFFNPRVEPEGSWSDFPIEISDPFAAGDSVQVDVSGPFHWWTNSDLPRSGYFARVSASALSEAAAQVRPAARNRSVAGAIPVDS